MTQFLPSDRPYAPALVMVGPGGILVEQVTGQRDLRRPPGPMRRVRKGDSYFASDCRIVAEVATLVDLATLVPELR